MLKIRKFFSIFKRIVVTVIFSEKSSYLEFVLPFYTYLSRILNEKTRLLNLFERDSGLPMLKFYKGYNSFVSSFRYFFFNSHKKLVT